MIFKLVISFVSAIDSPFASLSKRKQLESDLPVQDLQDDICKFISWANKEGGDLSEKNKKILENLKMKYSNQLGRCYGELCDPECSKPLNTSKNCLSLACKDSKKSAFEIPEIVKEFKKEPYQINEESVKNKSKSDIVVATSTPDGMSSDSIDPCNPEASGCENETKTNIDDAKVEVISQNPVNNSAFQPNQFFMYQQSDQNIPNENIIPVNRDVNFFVMQPNIPEIPKPPSIRRITVKQHFTPVQNNVSTPPVQIYPQLLNPNICQSKPGGCKPLEYNVIRPPIQGYPGLMNSIPCLPKSNSAKPPRLIKASELIRQKLTKNNTNKTKKFVTSHIKVPLPSSDRNARVVRAKIIQPLTVTQTVVKQEPPVVITNTVMRTIIKQMPPIQIIRTIATPVPVRIPTAPVIQTVFKNIPQIFTTSIFIPTVQKSTVLVTQYVPADVSFSKTFTFHPAGGTKIQFRATRLYRKDINCLSSDILNRENLQRPECPLQENIQTENDKVVKSQVAVKPSNCSTSKILSTTSFSSISSVVTVTKTLDIQSDYLDKSIDSTVNTSSQQKTVTVAITPDESSFVKYVTSTVILQQVRQQDTFTESSGIDRSKDLRIRNISIKSKLRHSTDKEDLDSSNETKQDYNIIPSKYKKKSKDNIFSRHDQLKEPGITYYKGRNKQLKPEYSDDDEIQDSRQKSVKTKRLTVFKEIGIGDRTIKLDPQDLRNEKKLQKIIASQLDNHLKNTKIDNESLPISVKGLNSYRRSNSVSISAIASDTFENEQDSYPEDSTVRRKSQVKSLNPQSENLEELIAKFKELADLYLKNTPSRSIFNDISSVKNSKFSVKSKLKSPTYTKSSSVNIASIKSIEDINEIKILIPELERNLKEESLKNRILMEKVLEKLEIQEQKSQLEHTTFATTADPSQTAHIQPLLVVTTSSSQTTFPEKYDIEKSIAVYSKQAVPVKNMNTIQNEGLSTFTSTTTVTVINKNICLDKDRRAFCVNSSFPVPKKTILITRSLSPKAQDQSLKTSHSSPLEQLMDLISNRQDKSYLFEFLRRNKQQEVDKKVVSEKENTTNNQDLRNKLIQELLAFINKDSRNEEDILSILKLIKIVKEQSNSNNTLESSSRAKQQVKSKEPINSDSVEDGDSTDNFDTKKENPESSKYSIESISQGSEGIEVTSKDLKSAKKTITHWNTITISKTSWDIPSTTTQWVTTTITSSSTSKTLKAKKPKKVREVITILSDENETMLGDRQAKSYSVNESQMKSIENTSSKNIVLSSIQTSHRSEQKDSNEIPDFIFSKSKPKQSSMTQETYLDAVLDSKSNYVSTSTLNPFKALFSKSSTVSMKVEPKRSTNVNSIQSFKSIQIPFSIHSKKPQSLSASTVSIQSNSDSFEPITSSNVSMSSQVDRLGEFNETATQSSRVVMFTKTIEKTITHTKIHSISETPILTTTVEKPIIRTQEITTTKTVTEIKNENNLVSRTIEPITVRKRLSSTQSQSIDLSKVQVVGEARVPVKVSSDAFVILPDDLLNNSNVIFSNQERPPLSSFDNNKIVRLPKRTERDMGSSENNENKTIIIKHNIENDNIKKKQNSTNKSQGPKIIELTDNVKTVEAREGAKVIEFEQQNDDRMQLV
jgi:hypothetical protein